MYKPKRDECGLNEHQRRRGRTFPFVVSLPTDRPVMRLRESNGQRTFSLDAIERPGLFLRPGASVISGPSENKVKLYFYFSEKNNTAGKFKGTYWYFKNALAYQSYLGLHL